MSALPFANDPSDPYKLLRGLTPEQLDLVGFTLFGRNPAGRLLPYILGLFVNCMLLGVLFVQCSRWYAHGYKGEPWRIRILVLYTLLVNIGITVFLTWWNLNNFASNFGRYRQFLNLDDASLFYLMDAIVRFPVSAFFADRAYRAARQNKILGAVFCVLLLASLAIGVTLKALASQYYGRPLFTRLVLAWLSCHVICDVLTTAVISVFLYRSKTGWSQTDAVITRLMIMTGETQAPNTVVSIIYIIVYTSNTLSTWPFFFVFTGPLFAVCLVAVLNTKVALRRELESDPNVQDNNTYSLKSRSKQTSTKLRSETYTGLDKATGRQHTSSETGLAVSVESPIESEFTKPQRKSSIEADDANRMPVIRYM